MHFSLYLFLFSLAAGALKRAHPDSFSREASEDDRVVKQPRQERSFGERPYPEDLLAELRGKLPKDHLLDWPPKEEDFPDRILVELMKVLKGREWEPIWTRWLWLQALEIQGFDSGFIGRAVLSKSIKWNDLNLIKDVIDYHRLGDGNYGLLYAYFNEGRLQHASGVGPDLKEAVAAIKVFDSNLINHRTLNLLAIHLSDYPLYHGRKLGFQVSELSLWGPPEYIRLSLLLAHEITGDDLLDHLGNQRLSLSALKVVEELANQYELDFDAWAEDNEMYQLVHSTTPPSKEQLDSILAGFSLKRLPSSMKKIQLKYEAFFEFMHLASKHDFEWFTVKLKTIPNRLQLALAFKYPRLADFIQLPPLMPPITDLIVPKQTFSFEKANYFERIIEEYTASLISMAMQAHDGEAYSRDDYFTIGILSDPTQKLPLENWISRMPQGDEEEKEDWLTFVLGRNDPRTEGRLFGIPIGF